MEDGLVHCRRISVIGQNICLNPYCSGRWSRTLLLSSSKYVVSLVLILIVVEDGLVRWLQMGRHVQRGVLILIVVEDGLVHIVMTLGDNVQLGLNPYCSGRWSRTFTIMSLILSCLSLNPYCSGRWSRTGNAQRFSNVRIVVLILIVVEDGLVQEKVTW